jgi:hypothetical protein
MDPAVLEAIRRRYIHAVVPYTGSGATDRWLNTADRDRGQLLLEVDRLRALLDGAPTLTLEYRAVYSFPPSYLGPTPDRYSLAQATPDRLPRCPRSEENWGFTSGVQSRVVGAWGPQCTGRCETAVVSDRFVRRTDPDCPLHKEV